MPLVHQHKHSRGKIALWYITETVDELHNLLTIDNFTPFKNIRRSTHWLSARLALQTAVGKTSSKIIKSKQGKPFLDDDDGHISISHSGEMAAAMFNTESSCGIDLELYDPRIKRIAYKFTSDYEGKMFPEGFFCACACVLWSAKESVFKFGEKHDVDFIEQIQMLSINFETQTMDFCFSRTQPEQYVKVYFRVYEAKKGQVFETPLLPDEEMNKSERYILTWL